MTTSILITGASGFIGSYLVEEAVKRGYSTCAGIRGSSSRKYLKDLEIHYLELDLGHPNKLRTQLSGYKSTYNKFDYIIHCAGATKCSEKNDFHKINYLNTKYLAEALIELNMIPKQFIFISTLSVFGPVREKDFTPITDQDEPKPNTHYGISKLRAERFLQSLPDFPYVIYRPTGVYGPRERDYYLMARSIRNYIDFSAGTKRQDLTFIHVYDLVSAVFLGIDKGISKRCYFLSDGNVYQSRDFSRLIMKELGRKFVFHFKCPLFALKVISLCAEFGASVLKTSSTLNSDKYNIMKQRNWRCDITPTINELGFKPKYDLELGVKETIAWYKHEKWL